MKREISFTIRENVLKAMLEKLSDVESSEINEIVEDAIIQYLNIKSQDLFHSTTDLDNNIILYNQNSVYYVYAFLDPRKKKYTSSKSNITFQYEPFYIGKGFGNRINQNERNIEVTNRILEIEEDNVEIIRIKLKDSLTSVEALELENNLIYEVGTIGKDTGPLLNKTSGQFFKNTQNIISINNIELHTNKLILDTLNSSKTIRDSSKKLGMSERNLHRKIKALKIYRDKVNGGKYKFD